MPELVDRRTPLSATLPEDDGLTRECSLNELGTGAHVGEDPWASAPTQEGDVIGSILDNQKGLACPKGHTLIEVSLMCDICHGKSNSGLTTGNSPVLFCKQCQSLICFSCIQDVSKSCLQEHDVVVCRLFCDRCNYQTPYAVEKRRDPADNTFKTRKKFTVNPTDEEWEACERYVPNSQEFYGCKKCDYDICTKCYSNRLNKNTSASVVVRGSRVHILSFRVDSTRNETILHQLANQARIAIPAVLNFLYLKRTTKRACLYFGRYDECGKTVGVGSSNMRNSDEFPEQLRNEFLKIMMHEIWPPLRVDSPSGNKPLGFVLQSDMQALLWIKKISTGRCYVKLILQNIPYLYFDNVRPGQDKYRWKNRRLHVRRLDNLETEKAVESYEVYFQSLKTACKWAHAYYKEKGPRHVDGKVTVTKGDKLYSFAERLYDEEDSSLDYKSYWVDPLGELLSNVPKFMTGFANAYGKGKLLVGVMEVHKYELLKQPQVKGKWWKTFRDTYVPDKWIDGPSQDGRVALVLGLSISNREVAALVKGLTQSFKSCIPPLPPSWVSIRLHPTKPPQPWVNFCGTGVGVIFYTNEAFESERVVGGLRAKAHRVLRTLLPYGLVLVQIPDKNIPREHLPGHITSTQSILYYVVVRGDGNQAGPRSYAAEQCGEQMPGSPLTKPEWREKIDGYKMEGYAVVELNEYVV